MTKRNSLKKLHAGEKEVIPVMQEEVKIGKRTVQKGVTRIRKIVSEKVEIVDEPLREDDIRIERVPVNRYIPELVPVRDEDGTMVIPVIEEVLVTEKRLLLKEELHIRKLTKTVHKPVEVVLRREEAVVEHIKKTPEEKS